MAQHNAAISTLITAAFTEASRQHPAHHERWIGISAQIGGMLPGSLLFPSIQKTGALDLLLRSMEDEDAHSQAQGRQHQPLMAFHYQLMLSELWVGSAYELIRLLKERKLVSESIEFTALLEDLRLIRVPLEKHEIARQGQLQGPLNMKRYPANNNDTDTYVYAKEHPLRSHIMPTTVSPRGSLAWLVIDVAAEEERWIERRSLSDRVIGLWSTQPEEAPGTAA